MALLLPLIAAVVFAYTYRDRLFGLDLPIRIACVVALVILGWAFAMNLGRAIGPALMKRLEPGTAGTVGNLIAGTVLLSARPFRVGDRIRVHAGGVAGTVEGTVTSLGLLYTTLANRADRIMVPNNVVLSAAVVPLREPDGVDVRARLDAEIKPSEVERLLREAVTVETRTDPDIELEEMDAGQMIYRIRATPADGTYGPELADEVVAALDQVSNGRHVG